MWRERSAFVLGVAAGAPPDFFYRGQNWGFPPYHPRGSREQGYRYFRDILQHLMPQAGSLRLDHIPGLHRLFYIPDGMAARDGAYVRAPANEFYAILSLESHRHRTQLIGEDAGLLPPDLHPAMARHRIDRIFVAQYQHRPDCDKSTESIPANVVASFNTHDLAPFAAFWRSEDLHDLLDLDSISRECYERTLYDRAQLRASLALSLGLKGRSERNRLKRAWIKLIWRFRRKFKMSPSSRFDGEIEAAVFRTWLKILGESSARRVLVNLEDLWLCPDPQNVPGTWKERPNWIRRARYTFEQFVDLPEVRDTLVSLDVSRRQRSSSGLPMERNAA